MFIDLKRKVKKSLGIYTSSLAKEHIYTYINLASKLKRMQTNHQLQVRQ